MTASQYIIWGIAVLLCCFVYNGSAQVLTETLPFDSAICTAAGDGYVKVDKSAFYRNTAGVVTKLCVKKYLDACATPNGLQTCNMKTSSCAPVGYSFDDAVQYPDVAARMLLRPEICTTANTVLSAATGVVLVAQIIISAIVLITAFIVFAVLVKCSPVIKVLLAVYLIPCIILLFSYYYLNAIVMYTTVLIGAACLGFRTERGFALCCAFLLLGFFWVTYAYGLGFAQHHARLRSNAANFGYQSSLCDAYYDGYFAWPEDAHGDNQNLALLYRGFCNPDWLAAELFFMILVEQFMVPFIAIAALLHFHNRDDVVDPSTEAF